MRSLNGGREFDFGGSVRYISCGWQAPPPRWPEMNMMRTHVRSHHPSGETVLKKAAIIVAGSAAAILAAAPLALAHGYDHSPKCDFAKQKAANAVSQPANGVTAPRLGA